MQLVALAATLTSQQVTQYRAGTIGGEPDAASRLAGSLNNLSNGLADLGRREDALAASQEAADTFRELAAIQEAAGLYWELAAQWPDAYQHELEQSLRVVAWLEHGEDVSNASPQEP